MKTGDVVLLFGNWVMDMEHSKYFETHPVKAYYLLCTSQKSPDDWGLAEETPANECEFDPTIITAQDMDEMCKRVQDAEKNDPPSTTTTTNKRGMTVMP